MSPKSLFDNNGKIPSALLDILESHKGIILFLDYDGTLVPIKQTPSLAVLPKSMNELLNRLANKRKIKTVLISGRSHSDLKSLIHIQNIMIVSNHGFRISAKKTNWVHHKLNKYLPSLKKIARSIKKELNNFAGALVEDKELTLTVHFRKVENHSVPSLKKIIFGLVHKHPDKFITTLGKKVIEVRPNIDWHKGKAVLKILTMFRNHNKKYSVIYIGDDKTDEDAFEVLHDAITIRVGHKNNSLAKYYLNNIREVQLFLNKIESLKA
ncbi:MAG: trehalose-phosphatase [Melioribacteraceae bacterium]